MKVARGGQTTALQGELYRLSINMAISHPGPHQANVMHDDEDDDDDDDDNDMMMTMTMMTIMI